MNELKRLIQCQYPNLDGEICGAFFSDATDFEKHLKIAHHKSLKWYKKQYPDAPTQVSPEDIPAPQLEYKTLFSPSSITDPDYIRQVLEQHFPEKWVYFQEAKKELLESGIPECKALDQFVMYAVLVRDMHLEMMARTGKSGTFVLDSEEIKTVKEISEATKKSMETIKSVFERTTKERTIDQYLEQLMSEAQDTIRTNLGEQNFMCKNCGAMIDTSGFAHWAFELLKDVRGKNIYLLWSDHIWEMVRGIKTTDMYGNTSHHQFPVWYMAFTLMTSIEGLMYTANARGMTVERFVKNERKWARINEVEFDLGHEEEQLRLAREHYEAEYHKKSVREI